MHSTRPVSRWLRRSVAVIMIAGFVPVATAGCFGKFRLVRKVYQFNKDISHDKWVQWLAFLVLVIVPIYGIATLVDAIVANSLEFWTGTNPIQADVGTRKVVKGPNGETITLTVADPRRLHVLVEEPGGAVRTFELVKEGDAVSAWDADGRLLARVSDVAGRPALTGGSLGVVAAH
jgi:hypothetical protein